MVRWAQSPLDQSQAHAVTLHWDDIVRHLAPPTVAWTWGESDLAPRTKHRLKAESLIEKTSAGRWQTTGKLWLDVIDRAGDDEEVGRESEGQELLTESVGEERESRVLDRQSPSLPGGKAVQQTLTGDDAEVSNDDEEDRIETNLAKAENELEDESGVAPGQLRLAFFGIGQTTIGAWADILGVRDGGTA